VTTIRVGAGARDMASRRTRVYNRAKLHDHSGGLDEVERRLIGAVSNVYVMAWRLPADEIQLRCIWPDMRQVCWMKENKSEENRRAVSKVVHRMLSAVTHWQLLCGRVYFHDLLLEFNWRLFVRKSYLLLEEIYIEVMYGQQISESINSISFLWNCTPQSLYMPLWSSGQCSWLLNQRSWIRFPVLPNYLRSSGSGTGSTQFREDKCGATWKKSSGFGLENWH
jgi:hypothetical protein